MDGGWCGNNVLKLLLYYIAINDLKYIPKLLSAMPTKKYILTDNVLKLFLTR
jgi:hypothetical protein